MHQLHDDLLLKGSAMATWSFGKRRIWGEFSGVNVLLTSGTLDFYGHKLVGYFHHIVYIM